MTANERALRTARLQLQIELVQAGVELALAETVSLQAKAHVESLSLHCESAMREMREAMRQSRVNVELIRALRILHEPQKRALDEWRSQLAAANHQEQLARAGLANLRHRDRSLEDALQAELRSQKNTQAGREMVLADDRWLQQTWSQQTCSQRTGGQTT